VSRGDHSTGNDLGSSPSGGAAGRGRRPARRRLDLVLVERGLAESRSLAQRLILAGEVRVDGEAAGRPSQLVSEAARVEVQAAPRYVSRGGFKLEAALHEWGMRVEGRICADVGASTGGFTDCLLQHGARRVHAVDVGRGILHWKLRRDARVVVHERTNARNIAGLPDPIELATIDVSFISLRLILPVVARWLAPEADVVALVKPQFEAGRRLVGKGGVVRELRVHRAVLEQVAGAAAAAGLAPQGVIRSPLRGPRGNIEFLLWAKADSPARDLAGPIEAAVGGAPSTDGAD